MKKVLFVFLFISTYSTVSGQTARRFYNGLDLIFMSPDEEKTLPNEFNFLEDWSKKAADNIFYSDHQRNINPRNSASFNSLALIPKRKFDFDFLDTGFILSLNKDTEKRDRRINVLNNNSWNIKAYNAIIDFDKFNPENMTNNFYYMKILAGMSDEQMLANFINQTHTYGNYNDSLSITTRFIKALNKGQNLKLDETLDNDRSFRLSQLCDAINAQVPNSNCTFPPYLEYIKASERNKTIFNINKFYRPILNRGLEDVMNDELLPEGDFQFTDKNVTFSLPSKYFKNKLSKADVSFLVRQIDYNINYDFNKKSYYVDLILTSYTNSLSSEFELKTEYNNRLKGKLDKRKVFVKTKEFKKLTLKVYTSYIEVYIEADDILYESGLITHKLSKAISIN